MKNGIFLLSIGDELLDGRTLNTNASWFGEQLRHEGIPISEIRIISDDIKEISSALKEAKQYPFAIVTGGLGPTNDDRTLQGAAKAFGLKLLSTKASLKHVRDRYQARGLPLTEARLRLSLIPNGSKVLQNKSGTAPGLQLKINKTHFFFLPGPPNECRPIFTTDIIKIIKKRTSQRKLVHRSFWRTFGRGESEVYNRISGIISEFEKKHPKTFVFGIHISFPCIDLTFEAWKEPKFKTLRKKEIEFFASSVSDALGDLCFTKSRESLPETVFKLLTEKKLTLAVAESCTGGMLAKLLTDIPGSSECFIGSVVSYANSAKRILLDVSDSTLKAHGAVSTEVAGEMASGVRKKLNSDYSLSITGIAGPEGGTPNKPVGSVCLSIAGPNGVKTFSQLMLNGKGTREQNRIIATYIALDCLRREILNLKIDT